MLFFVFCCCGTEATDSQYSISKISSIFFFSCPFFTNVLFRRKGVSSCL